MAGGEGLEVLTMRHPCAISALQKAKWRQQQSAAPHRRLRGSDGLRLRACASRAQPQQEQAGKASRRGVGTVGQVKKL